MARTYGPQYERLWADALLLPGHTRLFESLAAEGAEYLGASDEEMQERLRRSWQIRAATLHESFPAGASPSELASYYAEQEHGLVHSLYWHSLEPDRYALHAVAGLHVVQEFAEGRRVLDFGHGIGSATILFARHGFEITLADVSDVYRSFARWRLERRALRAAFVDLLEDEPEHGAFDAIVSFDVLEHVPDPLETVARLRTWLRPGGVLVMNVAFGVDPENPEHLLPRRRGVLDRIRSLGFERIASPTLLVFYRREIGAVRRRLYRLQDLAPAVRDDLVHRWPAAARLLSVTRTPEL